MSALLKKKRAPARVLVVEDDLDLARLLQVQIAAAGHVVVMTCVEDFERLVDERDTDLWAGVDVAVVDVLLGGKVTGLDVLRHLRDEHPEVGRIANSGLPWPYRAELAELAQVILQKGEHGAKDLDAAIRRVARRRSDGGTA